MTKQTDFSWAELVKKADPSHGAPTPEYTFNGKPFFKPQKNGNWGFILHENKIDNDLKSVVKAGGEILERYNQHRGKFNQTKYSDLTMDHKNQLSGDRS